MKVKMLQTRQGSHDRFRLFKYTAGNVYDIPKSLALFYIEQGIGEISEDEVVKPKPISNSEIQYKKFPRKKQKKEVSN